MSDTAIKSTISSRIEGLTNWLDDQAPYAEADQDHLTPNSPAQAYWTLGYRAAMMDVLNALGIEDRGTMGSATTTPRAVPDA